jgi:hypothetical protein
LSSTSFHVNLWVWNCTRLKHKSSLPVNRIFIFFTFSAFFTFRPQTSFRQRAEQTTLKKLNKPNDKHWKFWEKLFYLNCCFLATLRTTSLKKKKRLINTFLVESESEKKLQMMKLQLCSSLAKRCLAAGSKQNLPSKAVSITFLVQVL